MKMARLLMSGILFAQCMVVVAMQQEEDDTKHRLLFLHMDVSNLEPRHGSILALAALLTNEKLNVQSELYEVIHNSYEVVTKIDPYLRQKYVASGLRQKVLNSEVSLKQVNDKLVSMLADKPNHVGMARLVGENSISLHHDFLKQKLPEVNRLISLKNHIHLPTLRASAFLFAEDDTFGSEKQNGESELKPQNSLEIVRSMLDEYKYYKTRYFTSIPEQTFHDIDLNDN